MGEVRYEMRPLGVWDRPVTEKRASSSRFRVGWFDAVDHLTREVDALGGWLVVIQVDADLADIRRDGMLRSRAKVGFPGVKVSFDSRHGPLTYATDAYEQFYAGDLPGWQANVRAITLGLEALRAVDRYGITRTGEQYRGWTPIAAKAAENEMTVDEAMRVLADASGLRVTLYPDGDRDGSVQAAFRKAARAAHPDAGGNADVFRLITKARDVLLKGSRS